MLGLFAAQDLADAVIDRRVGRMILAIHLEIDIQRGPAGAEIGLPLQLHLPARDRQGQFMPVFVVKGDGAVLGVHVLDRHVQHLAGLRADRQEAAIGLLAFLAQAGQHHPHDRVIAFGRQQQRVVELAGFIEFGRADEFVFEPEGVQETAQHGVVVGAEAVVFAEGIGHGGQRFLQMLAQHILVRDIFGHLAHPVHVVGKAEQTRGNVADHLERAADHRRARDFAKGADMRQAGRSIARLEQDIALGGILLFITFQHPARLLERPGLRLHCGVAQGGHRVFSFGKI